MNSYGKKNSRFNSISQPQLSLGSSDSSSQLDLTRQFINKINWSKHTSSLNELLNEESSLKSSISSLSNSSANNFVENNKLPALVRVVNGSYGIIKQSSDESALSKKYVNNLLLYNKSKSLFVLCQSIRFKDKKPFIYGKNISIPITYNGWFEILSEDGKSIRPILSIKELANHAQSANNFKKLFNKPKNNISYIVREGVNAYLIPSSNLKLVDCKISQVRPGDILQIVGHIYMNQSTSSLKSNTSKRIKMYKCQVKRKPVVNVNVGEMQTETLFIGEEALGKYSPVARIENISGVHKLADLVKKFRFPVTVQLVYGRAPATNSTSSGSLTPRTTSSPITNNFSPILRLLKVYEEENVLAYPIGRESCLIQVPTRINLTLRKAQNLETLLNSSNYLKLILDECQALAPEYSDMIHNLPETPPELSSVSNNLNTGIIQSCVKNLIGRTSLFDRSAINFTKDKNHKLQDQFLNLSLDGDNQSTPGRSIDRCHDDEISVQNENTTEDDDTIYKEVDDLYEYVRTGILPNYLDTQTQETTSNKNLFKRTNSSINLTPISAKKVDRNSEIPIHEESKKLNHNHHNQHNFQLFDSSYITKNINKRVNFSNVNQYQQIPPPPYSSSSKLHPRSSPLNSRKHSIAATCFEYNKSSSFQRIAVGGVPLYHHNDNKKNYNFLIEPDEGVVEKRENEWYESIQRFDSFNVKGFDGVVRYQTTDDENLMINNNKFNKQKQTKEVPNLRTFFSMERLNGAYLTEDIDSQRLRKSKHISKTKSKNLI